MVLARPTMVYNKQLIEANGTTLPIKIMTNHKKQNFDYTIPNPQSYVFVFDP